MTKHIYLYTIIFALHVFSLGYAQDVPYKASNVRWDASIKGHVNPGELINNEVDSLCLDFRGQEVKVKISRLQNANYSEDGYYHLDDWILTMEHPTRTIAPLVLRYYERPKIVYEGDLDGDGNPDFGVLLKRESMSCSYVLLTIIDDTWAMIGDLIEVAHNLRASGQEIAKPNGKKGEIHVTYSCFEPDDTVFDAGIRDSVLVANKKLVETL